MNWNDIRYLLAVARTGTLSAAARETGVNQTTVARRMEALEQALGATLFNRRDGRLLPTAVGQSAIDRARRVEAEVLSLESAITDREATLSGTVRVSTVEAVVVPIVAPRLRTFQQAYPRLSLEIVASSGSLDMSRREVDIAIRLVRPDSGDLTVRKVADVGFAVYGAALPQERRPLHEEQWITYDERLSQLPEVQWVFRSFRSVRPVLRTNSVPGIAAALRAGIGVGVLPCSFGDRDPGLRRRSGPFPVVVREAWMMMPRDLRSTARVRAVADWLVGVAIEEKAALLGRLPQQDRDGGPESDV